MSAILGDRYATAAELPAADAGPRQFGSEVWLTLSSAPAGWAGKIVQVELFAWDAGKRKWEADPIAVTDRLAGPMGNWQHCFTLLAPADSRRAKTWSAGPAGLHAGKYRAQVGVGGQSVGTIEIESNWNLGFQGMTAVDLGRTPLRP